jgi:Flp pilus assembly protein TadB
MTKTFLQLAAVGLAGFTIWKLASLFFIPLFFWALKIALIVGVVMLVVWLFRKRDEDKQGDAPPSL